MNSRHGFTGARFKTPPVLPKIEKVEPEEPLFPAETRAAGVTMGEFICETCNTIYNSKVALCTSCGSSFMKSLRQYYLSKGFEAYIAIAHLKPEPENPFDPNAVAVYIRIDKELQKVGYVPSKRKEHCNISSEEVAEYLRTGKTLWTNCRIIGGPNENGSDKNYGLILWIHDKPPIDLGN